MKFNLIHLAMLLALPCFVFAQNPIPPPDEFLPNKYGEQFTQHHHLLEYFRKVGELSDMVRVEQYGTTYEGRPLIMAFVSSPENIRRLDQIRENNLKHAGILEGDPDPALDRAITWLSFGVHGNEAGASESAINVLYELLSSEVYSVGEWLENTVVIIDPCLNPDGYNRYVQWYLSASGQYANPHVADRQHHEPWPGGRTNHYYYDLNRDWAWATQKETRQRLKVYNQWLPHIHVDYHEQFPENPYYFAPATEPFHYYITDWQRELQERIGRNNAKYFDAQKWLYFTREVFDLFYPAYGDTYPTFNGAVGMTYEQAGHGIAGRKFLLDNGATLTLADRILHHTTTAMSTIEAASENSADIVAGFARYYSNSINDPHGAFKTYIIKFSEEDIDTREKLLSLLRLHDIKFGFASGHQTVSAYSYKKLSDTLIELDSELGREDVVLSAYQPKSTLLQVLLEPESLLSDTLTYDITAWSLPYAYGLEVYATRETLQPSSMEVPIQDFEPLRNEAYAFLMKWNGTGNARLAASIMKKGIRMRYTTAPLSIGNEKFPNGSIVITRADNDQEAFYPLMEDYYEKYDGIHPVYTGWTTNSPDLGSDRLKLIEPLKILLLSGEEVSSYGFGQMWQFLDRELGLPYTMVEVERLERLDLHEYNTILMPEGNYASIDKEVKGELKKWMSKGGKIIAVGSAINVFEGEEGLGFNKFASEESEKEAREKKEALRREMILQPWEERIRASIPDWLPGAIVRLELDTSYPLAYGLGQHYFSLKTSSTAWEHLENAVNVGYLEDEVKYQGFIGKRALDKIKGSSSLFVIERGKGKFIAMVDNPLYRGFWQEGKFLFSNALFF